MQLLIHLKNGQVGLGFRLPWPHHGHLGLSLAFTEFPREPSWGGGLSRKFFLASNHILSCCSFVLSCWVSGLLLLPLLLKCQAAPSWLGGVGRLVNLALLVIGGTKAQRGQGPEATQLTGGGVRI